MSHIYDAARRLSRPLQLLVMSIIVSFLLSSHACGHVTVDPGPPIACADEQGASGDRLKARWRVGTDGARQFIGLYDAELDADCIWGGMADGSQRCVPATEKDSGDVGSYYADEGCVNALVLAPLCDGPEPRFGVEMFGYACGLDWHMYEVGARWDGHVWQQPPGNACVPSVLPKGYGVWATGREMAPEEFVSGTVEIDE